MRRFRARGIVVATALAIGSSACITVTTPTPAPTDTPTPEPLSTPEPSLPPTAAVLAQSVVQVLMIVDDEPVAWGSGTVISDDGLILTNAHVATPDDVALDELVVAVTGESDAPPEPRYTADVVAADTVLDLAIIQIIDTLDGDPYEDGAIPPIAIGDSDAVEIGDDLLIFGYPAIGGETITFTRGQVSGFTSDNVLGDRAWIKTDATIAGGNSGGMAANTSGELVGVPTQASAGTDLDPVDCRPVRDTNRDGQITDEDDCVPLGGFLNGVRPVNLSDEMLAAVESGVAYEPIGGTPGGPTGFDPTIVDISRPIFDDVQPEAEPAEDPVWLPSGVTELCAWWSYDTMSDGVSWDAVWALDGEVQEEISYLDEQWTGGESGEYWVCFTEETGIANGIWDLSLNVEGEFIRGSSIGVGDDLEPVTLTIRNSSPDPNRTICYLFVSPTVTPFWGRDWLGTNDVLEPGESVDIELPVARYDIRGDDCDRGILLQEAQDLTEDTTLTFN